ncbi:hypothetical protein FLJC2902T_30860 [Flavobacterium limnosediminis JC2902]|uniref:Secretion system C-terminal sorting domain-containing protein n=1 Tax=Flavobacterium limnosediminis JC2902 TaxID=1341181 RepID=V6SGB2_9FLAO|nr:hypothetical protein FLJC2902T_30860 [Flavobacterium limnosediminis JC2902]
MSRAAGESIGNYAIGQGSLALNPNYDLDYVGADFEIVELPLTATVTKKDVTCNGEGNNGEINISNPSGGSGSYQYRLNSNSWQSSGNFVGLLPNAYTVEMRDTAHPGFIKFICTITILQPTSSVTASCTTSNNTLYFGYTGDQTSTITVKPGGGEGPYTVSLTMNRPLMANVTTNTGDELWACGANTHSSSNNVCPATGSFQPTQYPVSVSTNTITASGGYSLNVTLMADTVITATVTDKNGCTGTCSIPIFAEDVRCFNGNSGNTKVQLCHKTGSGKNPCTTICVDSNAVAEHLAHGDFFGKCTSNCISPDGDGKSVMPFNIIAYPNPSNNEFTFEVESSSAEKITITVFDIAGRIVKQIEKEHDALIQFGDELPRGVYLSVVEQGSNRKTVRVIKE